MRNLTTVEIDRDTHNQLRTLAGQSGFKIRNLAVLLLQEGMAAFAVKYPEFSAGVAADPGSGDRMEPSGQAIDGE